MSRATDICTCGKDRADHGNATGHEFMPHPQPNRTQPNVDIMDKVVDYLTTLGKVEVQSRFEPNDYIILTLPTGEVWTMMSPIFRSARSQEGV